MLRYKLFFLYILPQKIVQRRFETALEAHSKELYLALVLAGAEKHNPHQLTGPPWSALYKIRQTPWNSFSGIWEIPQVDLALNLKQNEAAVDAAKQNEAQVQSMDLEKLEAITWDWRSKRAAIYSLGWEGQRA